jgi:hypothetical protein
MPQDFRGDCDNHHSDRKRAENAVARASFHDADLQKKRGGIAPAAFQYLHSLVRR